MYKCDKCNEMIFDFGYNSISQHGNFIITNGKIEFIICDGIFIKEIEIETNNDEKDSICRR